jgi:hypothetical protein
VVAATTDQYGDVIPAAATVYRLQLYKFTGLSSTGFLNQEKFVFFRTPQAESGYDYDGELVKKDLTLTRVSPIKFTIFESDSLLNAAAADAARVYNYNSIAFHDMRYVKNDSRYFFTTQYPATSTVANRGGNPVSCGVGIKFSLQFSYTDTPGELLGFAGVGLTAGNTAFKTVQSNTVENSASLSVIARSEPGTGTRFGSLRIVTAADHNFEYGDIVFIENHRNSSNDLAVNDDEGWTITLYQDDRTITEFENGAPVTRGIFYIGLNLTYGGSRGDCYTKLLNQPFNLSGENYVLLSCAQLGNLVSSSSKVPSPFAKIVLSAPPGAILYSSFVSSDKVFDDQPLQVLEYLDIAFYDAKGELYQFNSMQHSFSLEVFYKASVTLTDVVDTAISSRPR